MSLNFHTSENFDTLRTEIINPCDSEDLPDKVKEALNHGEKLEPRLRELYIDVMKLKLRHFGLACETGLVIKPSLFWLAASPDGLAVYPTNDKKLLSELKSLTQRDTCHPLSLFRIQIFM